MITGTIKNKIDKIWKDIWASGLTQPITVIEQITYLMFIRSLDQKDIDAEAMENLTGQKQNKIFPWPWLVLGIGLLIASFVIRAIVF